MYLTYFLVNKQFILSYAVASLFQKLISIFHQFFSIFFLTSNLVWQYFCLKFLSILACLKIFQINPGSILLEFLVIYLLYHRFSKTMLCLRLPQFDMVKGCFFVYQGFLCFHLFLQSCFSIRLMPQEISLMTVNLIILL